LITDQKVVGSSPAGCTSVTICSIRALRSRLIIAQTFRVQEVKYGQGDDQ